MMKDLHVSGWAVDKSDGTATVTLTGIDMTGDACDVVHMNIDLQRLAELSNDVDSILGHDRWRSARPPIRKGEHVRVFCDGMSGSINCWLAEDYYPGARRVAVLLTTATGAFTTTCSTGVSVLTDVRKVVVDG